MSKNTVMKRNKQCVEKKSQMVPISDSINTEKIIMSSKLWLYKNLQGELWDTQPACIITDYVLALQAFLSAFYIFVYSGNGEIQHQKHGWHIFYFSVLGVTAAVGGFLHHVCYKAMNRFDQKIAIPSVLDAAKQMTIVSNISSTVVRTERVFGLYVKQSTIDFIIEGAWRMVLFLTSTMNFALIALSAFAYLSDTVAWFAISVAGCIYLVLALWSSIQMHAAFLLGGFVPALIFCGYIYFTTYDGAASHGIIALFFKLSSGLIQGLGVSPSEQFFNHNALAHVFLSFASCAMVFHCISHI